ncbi:MAG: exopolyphosphatase [Propionibacterium sp.]|nr:MAG: exopolyphosphatase [Propionibacterium sp.]
MNKVTNSTKPVAAIDCGTNSIRLLIMAAGNPPVEITRKLELVRLGQGVDATGEFHPDALARTFAACDSYVADIAAAGCEEIRFVATSAARDARNKEVFLAGVRQRFGVEAEVISGAEEAQLSFTGATSGVQRSSPVLVFDIGGGSTELVFGQDNQVEKAVSLDVGSVRITERFFKHRPPTEDEISKAAETVGNLLDESGIDFSKVATLIGVAGTVTSMAAVVQKLPVYDREKVHNYQMSAEDIFTTTKKWLTSSTADLISAGIHPMRAEVLPAGALILSEIIRRVPVSGVVVSESDILDGVAFALLATNL